MTGPVDDSARSRESRDQATIRALNEINPTLGGLFRRGRQLCGEEDAPDLPNMIGHVGRELTNALLRDLQPDTATPQDTDVANSNETQRVRIANAFGLSVEDDRVVRWFDVHQRLHGATHVGDRPHEIGPVRTAFSDLAELLYAAFGEYFYTQADLDAIADRAAPTPGFIERLKMLLIRPVHRRRFFSRLQNPAWIVPMTDAGFFRHPPARITYGEGSWRPREWPEGGYLARMAGAAPDSVLSAFVALPTENANPTIWLHVANAAEAMPADRAATLVPRLANALRLETAHAFSHAVLDATIALAGHGRSEAFALFKAFLEPRALAVPPNDGGSPEEYAARLRDFRRPYVWTDKWVLPHLEEFVFERLLEKVVGMLRAIDGVRTVKILTNRLHSIARAVVEAEEAIKRALRQADGDAVSDPWEFDEFDLESRRWCRSLVHDDVHRSVRGSLARATFACAKEVVGPERDAERTAVVVAILEARGDEIAHRMSLALLADAAGLNPELQDFLDEFIANEESIDPDFGAVETAAVLRSRFGDASQAAQLAFLARLEAGPGDDYITRLLTFRQEDATDALKRREIVEDWQRLRLRWFHDRIPEILRPLADRLGVAGAVPDLRTQSLDETGGWGFMTSSSVIRKSPIQSIDLRAMNPPDFAQYLRSWVPVAESFDPDEHPSFEGLETEVRSLAADSPEGLSDLLAVVVRDGVPVRYVKALAEGLRAAIQQNRDIDRALALGFADYAWSRAESQLADPRDSDPPVQWLAHSALELLREVIEKDDIRGAVRETAWSLCTRVLRSSLTWIDDKPERTPATFRAVSHASFGELGARAADTAISLAWNEFMSVNAGMGWPPPATTEAGNRLTPVIDEVLAREDKQGVLAQGALGHRFGQLLWMAHDWTVSRLHRLFDGGVESPVARPAWAVYLDRHNLMLPGFALLRPWYVQHALALPGDGKSVAADPDDAVSQEFVLHVGWAAINGECHPGEPDGLLEAAFDRSPLKARTHFYWSLWSSLRKPTDLRDGVVQNLVAFWEFRLTSLRLAPPSISRDEEVDSICQLIAIPQLPESEAIRLGKDTTLLLRSKQRVTTMVWDRLEYLMTHDPAGTFPIVERLTNAVLDGDFPYLPFDELAPLIRSAHRAGGDTWVRARALLHRIGGRGMDEYTSLWSELGGAGA